MEEKKPYSTIVHIYCVIQYCFVSIPKLQHVPEGPGLTATFVTRLTNHLDELTLTAYKINLCSVSDTI